MYILVGSSIRYVYSCPVQRFEHSSCSIPSTKIQNIALDVIQYNSFSYNAAYVALNNNEILESNSRPIYGCKTYFKIHVSN